MTKQFQIRSWRVDVQALRLYRSSEEVTLEPRTMALLEYFCRHPGVTVSKDKLLAEVWGSEHFSDSVVTRAISLLRTALGDSRENSEYIQTVPRRGYRFIAPVEALEAAPLEAPNIQTSNRLSRRRWPWAAAVMLAVTLAGWILIESPDSAGPALQAHPLQGLRSMAVAPFELPIEDGPEQPLAGLHFDVAAQLARLESPRIYLLSQEEIGQGFAKAAGQAGADAVLSGRVYRQVEKTSIELRLLRIATKELIWSSEYKIDQSQTFVTRQQMIRDLASLTRAGLARWESREQDATINAEAYESYLRALWFWRQRTPESLVQGQQLFEKAVRTDTSFADAYAGLALSHLARVSYGYEDRERGYRAAADAARDAIALDPENPWALTAQGEIAFQRDWDFERAGELFQAAIDAAPSAVDAHQYLAEIQSILGLHSQALQTIEAGLSLRPASPLLLGIKGMVQTAAGEYGSANATMETLEDKGPGFDWFYWYWSFAQQRSGDSKRALLLRLQRYKERVSAEEYSRMVSGIERDRGDVFWEFQVNRLQAGEGPTFAASACLLAEALSALGRADEAMNALRLAVSLRGEAFPMFRISPQFDSLRERPDFRGILSEYQLPPSGTNGAQNASMSQRPE
ncbi:MAG: winged helix-turn-helix domain-containing protein [Pseudomonadota bacterium]